ncbi:conserved hypothetical protein [Lebetimonas natsushimae]|uniref:Uncharacterized protein n=1 Tax=Lebetimonas natsushimae TaxID=1936991 RepID=A0A292YCV6_9BACT|nr:hypothetical protein [Lebetimonas natsushimae]GAX87263.1 conserved hypothetical protein [Lebetimonas natsushimae]
MLILEKPFSNEIFVKINSIEKIKASPSNSTLIFEFNENLESFIFCKENNIPYGVIINDIKELIFIANLNAKYAFTDNLEKAKIFQKIAENYLLDTKIIFLADSLDEIEILVKYQIDGIKLKDKG